MKTLRRVFELLPPAFIMRWWFDWHHKIKVRPVPGGAGSRFFLSILPYAFTAALSVRVESDCRLLKYFLPYGKMKRFVKLAYNMDVGNDTRDHGVIGMLRTVMPYGLVLWWDAEDERIVQNKAANESQEQASKVKLDALDVGLRMSGRERLELQRMDRIESLSLRVLIMASGKVTSQ